MKDFSIVTLQQSTAFVTIRKFADLTGVSHGVARGWCDKGYVPTFKIGRHRLVNIPSLISSMQTGAAK